ncbi:normal mucosa of esophagus-specific gene 1 protein-like [Malaya genurostris]|uniref:normal mucosa of esophagus-specific gene 1 protein-like n=1 Tax=Malaya genurostris TaxID=325434 RepID=UPI0026F3C467|nr:normal mucosa of esophagus-specific gene 1 protein-like [Malaya genurostris]
MSLRLISSPYFRRFLLSKRETVVPVRGMARSPYSDPRGFTFTDMKKNPAVIPLVVIIGIAVAGVCGFSVYSFYTRPDVSFNRKVYEWDTMDVMNPKRLKVFAINVEPKPMPELSEALSYREEYKKLETENH